MAIRVYGYRPTSAPPNRHANPANWNHHSIVGQDFNEPLPIAGRIIAMGSWTGSIYASFTWQKKWAAYLSTTANAAGNYPYLGETAIATVPANYNTNSGGADVNASVNSDTVLATRKSRSGDILAYVGDRFAIVSLDLDSAGFKQTAVGRSFPGPGGVVAGSRFLGSSEATNNFDAIFTPTNPNGLWAAGDKFSFYALIEENRAPSFSFNVMGAPDSTTPGGSPAIFSTTGPPLEVTFTDLDRLSGYNDYPKEIILTLLRWGGASWINEGETLYQAGIHYPIPIDASDEPTIELSAPAGLTEGETYRVHARGRDELDVWSPVYSNTSASWDSQLEFIIAAGGYVEDLTPSGRITDLTPDFSAVYRNLNPYDSAEVQIRLSRRAGSGLFVIDQTSPLIAKINSPDTAINVTWAETGFTALLSSVEYQIEWQITDSNDQIGPWIGRQLFHTNFMPQTPSGLSPANNLITSTAPRLTFIGTDPDDTPVSAGGNLAGFSEITGPFLVNGTFDVDATGWSAGLTHASTTATRARATDQVRTGAGSYKIDITANTATPGFADSQSPLHPIVEGYTYNVSVYRRLESANVQAQVGFYWYDSANVFLSGSFGPVGSAVTGAWEQIVAEAVAPAGATQMRIALRAAPAVSGNTGDVWFDDVSVSSGVRAVLLATKDTVGNQWYAQTSLTDSVAAAGLYSHRARMYDGDLFGLWSDPAAFTMSVGPEVDVTYPASLASLTTHRPLIEWVVTGTQNSYQVVIRDGSTGALRHDSGTIFEGGTRSYLIPSGVLTNLDDVTVQVIVVSPGPQTGYSEAVRFTVDYEQPAAPADLAVSYELLYGDDEASAIRLSWTPVDTAADLLVGIEIWRAEEGDFSSARLIATFAGFDPGTYLDRSPRSGVNYRYYIRQEVLQAGFERYGELASIDATIILYAALLEVVGGSEEERVVMRLWSSRSKTLTQQQTFVYPAGGGDYVEHLGFGTGRDFSISWQVVDAAQYGGVSGFTARTHLNNLERIFDDQHIYSYRDGTGNQEYVRIMGNPAINYKNTGGSKAEVTINLRRIAYTAPDIVDAN